jgi:pyruvate dehydrogenase E1 component
MATIVKHGLRRMYGPQPEDVFFYLTLYNENYQMPPMPPGVEDGISGPLQVGRCAGRARPAPRSSSPVRPMERLPRRPSWPSAWDVGIELCQRPYKALRDEALTTERWNRLHPSQPARTPLVGRLLADAEGRSLRSPTS